MKNYIFIVFIVILCSSGNARENSILPFSNIKDNKFISIANKLAPNTTLDDDRSRTLGSDEKSRKLQSYRAVDQIKAKVDQLFDDFEDNTAFGFVDADDKQAISGFKAEILDALEAISKKILSDSSEINIQPLNSDNIRLQSTDETSKDKTSDINVAVFEGSFDPFHMGHLLAMLRHLAHPETKSDFVLVVPNQDSKNKVNKDKPYKSDFRYRRFITELQTAMFDPLIKFWDAGKSRDTPGLFQELVNLNPGRTINATQIMGSDPASTTVDKIAAKIEAWVPEVEGLASLIPETKFHYHLHVFEREGAPIPDGFKFNSGEIESRFIRSSALLKEQVSSSAVRAGFEANIFLPTKEIIKHFEVLFRLKKWGIPAPVKKFLRVLEDNDLVGDEQFIQMVILIGTIYAKMPDKFEEMFDFLVKNRHTVTDPDFLENLKDNVEDFKRNKSSTSA